MSSALLALRRRWLLIVTLAAAAAGAVAAYSFTATKHYDATALLVVSPVSASDSTFLGIDVFRESQRRTAAATAARLIRTPEVADTVRVRLGLRRSAASLLGDVATHVVDGSDAVAVRATDTDPARAAQLANAFVDAFVGARTSAFQSEVASAVARLQRRVTAMSPTERVGPAGAELQRRLADTRALVAMRDPTVSAGSQAVQPRSASWPQPVRWTIYAALAGLGLGCLIALAFGLPGMRRRREPVAPLARGEELPELVAARLEQRLSERVDALLDEQTRLSGRESALQVREREIGAKLDELRAAAARRAPAPAAVDPEKLQELERREQTLGARVKTIEQRERELARRAAELARRESDVGEQRVAADRQGEEVGARVQKLDTREQQVAAREAKLAESQREVGARAAKVEEGERELHAREARLGDGERQAATRAQELGERERQLAAREAQVAAAETGLASRLEGLERAEARLAQDQAASVARELELANRAEEIAAQPPPLAAQARLEPVSAPRLAADAPPASPYARGWRLDELERLVARESPSRPDRADEWRSYLFYLRDYADAEGRVPSRFDWLIEDAFGELLARR